METELILDYESGTIAARLEKSEKTLVQGVRIRLRAGECLALIGETGSGKTMTALSIMRLLPENVRMRGGSLRFLGAELNKDRELRELLGVEIVYIPQNGLEFLNPSKKIKYHLYDSLKKLGVPRGDRPARAAEALAAVGFEDPSALLDKYPFQLSGGMAQRVTIALSACSRARLVLADEATNGLDRAATADFIALLGRLFPDAAKLIITHDIQVAALCGRTQVLCGGRAMECGPSSRVLSAPRHPYTKALIASLVENGMHETPLLREQAGPCPFYRRCGAACEACLGPLQAKAENGTEWWCSGA